MTTHSTEKVTIVEYRTEHRSRFREINEQWIRHSFTMEAEDERTLNDPEEYILKGGGKIFIALYDGHPIGTCGYLNFGNDIYEMIKMAVDEKYRGLKIGLSIGEQSIQAMKKAGAKKIFLYSNTKGSAAAIQLYYKLGFTKTDLGNPEFTRADIRMEMTL